MAPKFLSQSRFTVLIATLLIVISLSSATLLKNQRRTLPNFHKVTDNGSVIHNKLSNSAFFLGQTQAPTQAPQAPTNTSQAPRQNLQTSAGSAQPQPKTQSSQSAQPSAPAPRPVKSDDEFRKVDSYQQYLINLIKPTYLKEFETPFKNITAVGSDHVYDLIDYYDDRILLIDFYTRKGNHEDVVSDLKTLIGDNKK